MQSCYSKFTRLKPVTLLYNSTLPQVFSWETAISRTTSGWQEVLKENILKIISFYFAKINMFFQMIFGTKSYI